MANIEPITHDTLPDLSRAAPAQPVRNTQPDSPKVTSGPAGDEVSVGTTAGRTHLGQIQTVNQDLQDTAAAVRQTDRNLETLAGKLGSMKEGLVHVKNYPPYPPGDMARIKFLRSFNGLRQEIDRLTIPPEEKWTGYKVPDGVAEAPAQPAPQTTEHPSPPVAGAINDIPVLPDTASEADVSAAADKVDAALTLVKARHAALAKDAAKAAERGVDNKAAGLRGASSENLDITVPSEHDAEQKSGDAKQALAGQASFNGLTDLQVQLSRMIG